MITLNDLSLAYRKAKVDLYYSTNPPLFEIARYEESLAENLQRLLGLINSDDEAWFKASAFLGAGYLVPKAISSSHKKTEPGLIFAAPDDEWQNVMGNGCLPTAEFRLMARCSLDFHVFSALWLMRVGDVFDKKLGANVYGSRLRRKQDNNINPHSLGSFKPYLKPFRDWRDGGIKAMQSALAEKKKIVALTADVSSFYHELNPGFMLDQKFMALLGIELSESGAKLHRIFIEALQLWAKGLDLEKGLPVGLPASAVVANMALYALDQFIQEQVVPLYYGRYVDDILLVMENSSDIASAEQFWGWMFKRPQPEGFLGWENTNESDSKNTCILFQPDYLKGSRIAFDNSKNKLFILSGKPGLSLVNAISQQINLRASEWRALPDLPDSPETVVTNILKATNHDGEQADNLRKTDALSLHRAGFALNLRDYEAFERDLEPESWQPHRHAFFQAVIDHILSPVKYFELAQYFPRIIRMAAACEDFEYLAKMLEAMYGLKKKIEDNCQIKIKAVEQCNLSQSSLESWWMSLRETLIESIVASFPPKLSKESVKDWDRHMQACWVKLIDPHHWRIKMNYPMMTDIKGLQSQQARLFGLDLAHIPLRFSGLPKDMVSQRGIPARKNTTLVNPDVLLPATLVSGMSSLAAWLKFKNGIPSGLVFATRPFSLQELYLVVPDPFNPNQCAQLGEVILALRGFDISEHKMPHWDKQKTLHIPDGQPKAKHTIAVSSWETREHSFIAAIKRMSDPDRCQRYQRINRLINELLSRPDGAGYLILPEVAMPPLWFMRIAGKLKGRGLSLISGVEYLHAPKKVVRNQVWVSLTHDGLGFPSLMLYRQDKQRPALHEENELFQRAGVVMRPAVIWKEPPIIEHGDLRFAIVVCSELTNIHYRASLRGKIDALFVPEWNNDIDTFNALVESAALDIHAFIIQCNNRFYGDSRIRAPYKDRWLRDVLRVKGGNHDYCITGEIDVLALRQFQSSHRSPAEGFKPVPDGFNEDMSYHRKVLPKGE